MDINLASLAGNLRARPRYDRNDDATVPPERKRARSLMAYLSVLGAVAVL